MDEGTTTIALGPRSRKARAGGENQNCVVANKVQNRAVSVRDTEKLIRSPQNRRRNKSKIIIMRDDDDIDLR